MLRWFPPEKGSNSSNETTLNNYLLNHYFSSSFIKPLPSEIPDHVTIMDPVVDILAQKITAKPNEQYFGILEMQNQAFALAYKLQKMYPGNISQLLARLNEIRKDPSSLVLGKGPTPLQQAISGLEEAVTRGMAGHAQIETPATDHFNANTFTRAFLEIMISDVPGMYLISNTVTSVFPNSLKQEHPLVFVGIEAISKYVASWIAQQPVYSPKPFSDAFWNFEKDPVHFAFARAA